jgi:hypothetical protein
VGVKLSDDELLTRGRLLRASFNNTLRLARSLGCKLDDRRNFTEREWPGVVIDRILAARRAELVREGAA